MLICVVVVLLVFGAVSCSKRLNPFIPNNSSGNGDGEIIPPIDPPPIEGPDWFLPPEKQIEPFMEQTVIFKSEVENNDANKPKKIYRIPGITVSENNTIIAVADNRKDSYKDVGFTGSKNIDIVVRRSTDGGKTWDPEIIIPPIATSEKNAHGDSLFFSCANGDLVVLCAAEG